MLYLSFNLPEGKTIRILSKIFSEIKNLSSKLGKNLSNKLNDITNDSLSYLSKNSAPIPGRLYWIKPINQLRQIYILPKPGIKNSHLAIQLTIHPNSNSTIIVLQNKFPSKENKYIWNQWVKILCTSSNGNERGISGWISYSEFALMIIPINCISLNDSSSKILEPKNKIY